MGAGPSSSKGTKKRNHTAERDGRNPRPAKASPVTNAYGVPVPERLHDAIEGERDNLSKAESILGCLVCAMEYPSDGANAPYYPDVAQVARELVRKSISGLDPLVLQRQLSRNRIKEEGGLSLVRQRCVIARGNTWMVHKLGAFDGGDQRTGPMMKLPYKARVMRLHRRVTRNYGRVLLKTGPSLDSASANICG